MDWTTTLRAAVPLGAAALSVLAVFAASRDRSMRTASAERPYGVRHASASGNERRAARRGAVSDGTGGAGTPASRVLRRLAALVLLLLIGATGLVLATSRPLADVDITDARLEHAPSSAAADERDARERISASGSLAPSSTSGDAVAVELRVRSASGDDWTPIAEARPNEGGEWRLDDVPLPTGIEPPVDLRAVAVPEMPQGREIGKARDKAAGKGPRGSRVVRLQGSRATEAMPPAATDERSAP